MAGGSLADRRDVHQRGDAHEKAGQSSSALRLITAARAGHPHPIALDRGVEVAAALVVPDKSVEVVEQGHRWEPIAKPSRGAMCER